MLLEELGLRFDLILIDTPAAALAVDFQMVSAVTRGAVMVARRNVTRSGAAAACKAQVEAAGARVVGAILNDR
jgi:receptor protein-tyrosine kinase